MDGLTPQNQNQTAQFENSSVLGLLTSVPNRTDITKDEIITPEFPPCKLQEFIDSLGKYYAFYRISKISFDKDFPKREAFENVIECMGETSETFCNFAYVLSGNKNEVSLHIGVVINKETDDKENSIKPNDIAKSIKKSIEGNFNGSKIIGRKDKIDNPLSTAETKQVIFNMDDYEAAGVITGIPSVNEIDKGDEADFQGIDRLINSMLGKTWRIVIVCNRASQDEIARYKDEVYRIYNEVFSFQKKTVQISKNTGTSDTKGESSSETLGMNIGASKSDSKGTSSNHSWDDGEYSRGRSTNHERGTSIGASISNSKSNNSSHTDNSGFTHGMTVDIANKKAQEIIKYIDEELLERIRLGSSKGLFKTSLYYMAKTPNEAKNLKYEIISLFQGNKSSFSPLVARDFADMKEPDNKNLFQTILNTFQNQSVQISDEYADCLTLFGRPVSGSTAGLSTYLTGREISLLAGLPQKEVPGIVLKESVGFALNAKPVNEKIKLGHIMQNGRELDIEFNLGKESLSKHIFIAGTTGSGKTTTCHRLLAAANYPEQNCPFLVIEPAKTEYRILLNDNLLLDKDLKEKGVFDDVVVFTLGSETCAPFRLNPFELIEGENITSHIDMVKAAFVSAFPMEAAMPQLLEEAIYKCYEDKGWNIDTNKNKKYKNPFDPNVNSFPILSDLLLKMKTVVDEKGFGAELKENYIGSLVSRLSNLTIGSKGALLNCPRSINFDYIATHKVILELEELKSPEDKSLVMGFILSRLSATVRKLHKDNSNYKHITLVEEAHRLLSKVEYGDSGSKKSAVETFTDMLAEVRKYGEGLIIVDQIPNKLSSEVLKNTNTKIIHKIFAKDDKNVVGDTMLMDDKQKQSLSSLETGEAIIFAENTESPVHVKIQAVTDTNVKELDDDFVKSRFLNLKNDGIFGSCYDDLEIKPFYKDFVALAKKISRYEIDQELYDMVKDGVEHTMEFYSIDRKCVWQKVINYFELTTGNSALKSLDKIKDCLLRFFSEDFYREDFCEKMDIPKDVIENLTVA